MTSKKQEEANRRNSQKSTGPKTPKGKAVVKYNAMKHGILARETLLADESKGDLNTLGHSLRSQLQPKGELERLLVDRIISTFWRLRRLQRVEADLLDVGIRKAYRLAFNENIEDVELGKAFGHEEKNLGSLSRYEMTIERSLFKALHELQRLQAVRMGGQVSAPAALDVTLSGGGIGAE